MSSNEQSALLCTEEFFKETFGIDEYLSKCTQKSELLTLRKDLKDYGSVLYSSMVDILKMETEDIINLAESLTNLNSKINDLSAPVSQLCEEIRTLHVTISDAKKCFEKHLNKVQCIHSKADSVNLKMGILSSSLHINNVIFPSLQTDITILERAINEYAFQYLYLKEVELDSKIIDKDVLYTATKLLQTVHVIFINAVKRNDEKTILRSLRMYVNLNKQNEAENYFKEKVVSSVLNNIFTSRNLELHGQNVKVLYDQAVDFLNTNMKPLIMVVDRNPDAKGFNFVINSFWVEVDRQLCENLPNITAPGNPELFQRRFKDTWSFLQEIINAANDPLLYKKDLTFQAHMKRFNLPVYFEIRFQQIAAQFEAELLMDPSEFTQDNLTKKGTKDNLFTLKITSALWNCIQRCFHDEVFLIPLADQFLKLMMLLLSRYLKWFESHLAKWSRSSPVSHKLEEFSIYALIDITVLKNVVGFTVNDVNEFANTIFKVIPHKMRLPLKQILKLNWQTLDETYTKLQDQLVNFKVQQCIIHLQQVTSIPRLYRRTNRTLPKEPSNYVIEAVAPITKLHSNYNILMGDKLPSIMDSIIARLSEQYVSLVQEVLLSVCKTEESLRRLKNRNLLSTDDSLTQTIGDPTSDEAKIREQIKLDVGYFIKELKLFAVDAGSKSLTLLINESGYQEKS